MDELEAAFRRHEFNREYSDWDRRFSSWIEKEKTERETAQARAGPARKGSAQRDHGMTGMENFKGVRG